MLKKWYKPIIKVENKFEYSCKNRWYLTAHSGFSEDLPIYLNGKGVKEEERLPALRENLILKRCNNGAYIYDSYLGFIYMVNSPAMHILWNLKYSRNFKELMNRLETQYLYVNPKDVREFLYRIIGFFLTKEDTGRFPWFKVQWDITFRCNLVCKHCELNSDPLQRDYLSFEDIKEIIDQFNNISYATYYRFSGGEPFFLPYFLDIIEYITRGNNSIGILTNGTLITTKVARELKEIGRGKVKYIRVSLSGAKAETHDRIRGEGSFKRTIKGIRNLVKEGFFVDVAYDCYKGNIDEIEDAIKLCIKLNVKRFGISFIQPKGRAIRNFRSRDLIAFTNLSIEKMLYSLNKKYEGKINVFSVIKRAADRLALDVHPTLCQLTFGNYIFINPKGEVYPCPEFYTVKNHERFRVGKLPDDSIAEILLLRKFKMFKTLSFVNIKRCKDCKFLRICESGCRIEALKSGSLYLPDPNCEKIKILCNKIVKLLKLNA